MLIPRNNLCVSTYSAVERYSFAFQIKMQFIRKWCPPTRMQFLASASKQSKEFRIIWGYVVNYLLNEMSKKFRQKVKGKSDTDVTFRHQWLHTFQKGCGHFANKLKVISDNQNAWYRNHVIATFLSNFLLRKHNDWVGSQ
jgi:hypothetical protein